MVALFGFILGLIVGGIIYHFFFRLSPEERKQEDALNSAQLKLKTYHHQVSEYLNHSAELITQLQGGLDRLQHHILEGSVKLNLDSQKQSALQPAIYRDPVVAPIPEKPLTATPPITPPKDYA